ncbi:hypothetical protein LOTGIDRAFT_173658 [Lottia gigantea]|uniref:Uncharacterized protein n=1 Tax=Lottia gigantea TaxID=225164 RepID=V4CCM1_LOTGI|nr:hypothetical protein LOTGIDRAFT_173658 [Lottia gigantea]ESO99649.1 hypothetical protein LOTGIDRAFT_173658 [Lottia gigantea]
MAEEGAKSKTEYDLAARLPPQPSVINSKNSNTVENFRKESEFSRQSKIGLPYGSKQTAQKSDDYDNFTRKRKLEHVISDSDSEEEDIIPSPQIPRHITGTVNNDVIDQIDQLLAQDPIMGDNSNNDTDHDQDMEMFESALEQEYTIKNVEGAKVNDKIIGIVNQLFVKVLPEEKLKVIFYKYPEPANMNVVMPLVNKEIWGALSSTTKTADLRNQRIHMKITKSSYSLAELMSFLMESKRKAKISPEDISKAIRMAMDAITLLAQANREFVQRRKDSISSCKAIV